MNEAILRILAAASFAVYGLLFMRRLIEYGRYPDDRSFRGMLMAGMAALASTIIAFNAFSQPVPDDGMALLLGILKGAFIGGGLILLAEPPS